MNSKGISNDKQPSPFLSIAALRNDLEQHQQQFLKEDEKEKLFLVKTANQWIEQARKRPIPNMLFGEFWFEGEICLLFADSNVGKSILAVQIANSLSKREPVAGFKLQAPKQRVLYFDFELSDKQFEIRYSEEYQHHLVNSVRFVPVISVG